MRNSSNRRSVERLFVLGAGASVAASEVSKKDGTTSRYQTPLDSEFPERIARIDLQRPKWIQPASERVEQKFRPDKGFANYPLEEGIQRQLRLLDFFESIHPARSRNQIGEYEWLNLVTHLICAVLRRGRQNNFAAYSKLVKRRFPPDISVGELPDRIISFNYDSLLDSLFLEGRDATDVYFDALRSRRDREAKGEQENPLLLKLHGSINWRSNDGDLRAIIEGKGGDDELYEIPRIWLDRSQAPSPDDEVSPLIMPPLPSKPVTSIAIFNWLWTRAYEYLYEAEELVIVGYSLPAADQLAESMFGAFRNDNIGRVVVVDPATEALDRWREVLKRSGLGSIRWTYYESFRDYLSQECTGCNNLQNKADL